MTFGAKLGANGGGGLSKIFNDPEAKKKAQAERFRQLLDRYYKEVMPLHGRAWDSEKAAQEFARVALQAAFLLNGGALVALPPLMQWLSDLGRMLVPKNAGYFVWGIVFGAAACLFAYFNFRLIGAVNRANANIGAMELNADNIQKNLDKDDPNYRKVERTARWGSHAERVTQLLGVGCAVASFVAFWFGVWGYIGLAQAYPPPVTTSPAQPMYFPWND